MNDLLKQVAEPLDQSIRHIVLTQGQVAIVNASDFDWLSRWKWTAVRTTKKGKWYAYRSIWNDGASEPLYMHVAILKPPPGKEIDHHNGNGLDNRRKNLRICTKTQNMANRGKQRNNTSGYKGVTWHKQRGKWKAGIQVNGRHHHLGLFTDPAEAAHSYDAAATRYFGDFAHLNFP